MIIPSIDLMKGNAVQLVGGKKQELDAGDPVPIAERFRIAGEIAVVDLDAALGQGNNEQVIKKILNMAPCRLGGGIRSVDTAIHWLDAGAAKVVLGTAAVPQVLQQLPADRVIAALDAEDGIVVVDGWRKKTGVRIEERMQQLRPYVSGFLVTLVEREGRMQGSDLTRVIELVGAANGAALTIAGGVTTAEEVGEIHRAGADAQVGMALYKNHMRLGDAIVAPLHSDRNDGLWPTVVVNEQEQALGLVYSNLESVNAAVDEHKGIYYSRSRQQLWKKGETSGASQTLRRIDVDCDSDALRFVVEQASPGFCHRETDSCWGDFKGVSKLLKTVAQRKEHAPEGSYTQRLFNDSKLLQAKLLEEAQEVVESTNSANLANEIADFIYFSAVKMTKMSVTWKDVEASLDRKSMQVTRRPGDAKSK